MARPTVKQRLSRYLEQALDGEITKIIFGYDQPPPPIYWISEHHNSRIIVPLAGRQEIFYADKNSVKKRCLCPGDVFFSVKNGWAWITREGESMPFEIISVVFTPAYTRIIHVKNDSGPVLAKPDLFYHVVRGDSICSFMIQALDRMAHEARGRFPQIKTLITALLYEVKSELNSAEPKSLSKSQKTFGLILDYLNEHFCLPINRKTVGESLNLNPCYISRLFRRKTGDNFSTYLIKLRLNKAAFLLRHTSEKTSSIAQSCGFSSCSYFISSFKNVFKITPVGYRLQNNEIPGK